MMLLKVLCIVVVLGYAQAQVFSFGGCPDINLKQDFDLSKYFGKWFDIQHFYAVFQARAGYCIRANYTLKSDGTVDAYNRGLTKDKKLIGVHGVATQPDPVNNKPKLKVKFAQSPVAGDYWIVDTDYDNYSIVYSCKSVFGLFHYEFAWILARVPALPKETIDYAKNLLGGYGLKVNKFQVTNQDLTFCPPDM